MLGVGEVVRGVSGVVAELEPELELDEVEEDVVLPNRKEFKVGGSGS